jgi:hypothetical protein
VSCTCFDPYCIIFKEKRLMIKEVIVRPNDFCIHQLFLLEDDLLRIEMCRLWIWISGRKKRLSVALVVYSFCYCTVWNESVWDCHFFQAKRTPQQNNNNNNNNKRHLRTSALYNLELFQNLIYTTDGLRRKGNIVYYESSWNLASYLQQLSSVGALCRHADYPDVSLLGLSVFLVAPRKFRDSTSG